MTKRFAMMSCLLAMVALAGCETVKGASRDVHSVAETVQGWF
ncbi:MULTISPECIES: entericidin [unclassified Aliiroseovarius]|nr:MULTISPECIES: entericidin [unclassified Aliiroseovarius]NRP11823.1 hypothetical protein [Aliiroseovarius sp. xm-d-517]NRP42149.1 hypothetical protein [Aliiroseovarius sp. xm-m-339-2]NRP63156.1 hypothetical protein [Aliiroseovarius sp. xm-a-151]